MDIDKGIAQIHAHISSPKPLRIHKQSSQAEGVPIQHLVEQKSHKRRHHNPTYPPRTSSLRNSRELSASGASHSRDGSPCRHKANTSFPTPLGLSSYKGDRHSNTSTGVPSSRTTARSTVSSYKAHYLSDPSSGIIGDFVPLYSPNMANPPLNAGSYKSALNATSGYGKVARHVNPYEFDPDSPYVNSAHETKFADFIENHGRSSAYTPRSSHKKNSRSEGNAFFWTRKHTPFAPQESQQSRYTLQRSESSPSVTAGQSPETRSRSRSPDVLAHPGKANKPVSRRDRPPTSAETCGQQNKEAGVPASLYDHRDYDDELRSRSPIRLPYQDNSKDPALTSSGRPYHQARSPTRTLPFVLEWDDSDSSPIERSVSPSKQSKKRSRSPMKKMFGEHGWLGQSPDELQELKLRSKKSYLRGKEKTTVMGKLRNKFEELAEKADLSPGRGSRSHEKHPKLSVLSVSLGAPEQARIYMEIELMLVHTANSFLMNQFSQGRISVDSIKKTVDKWKTKGRPTVIEFMYDQATQRDLVAINQHNFRFHGNRAGDSIRIDSMLYNWKRVAALMSVRTFCDADTVVLKLLFDVEQILEFLGAREPIMLRLQQIEASANDMMRVARQKAQSTPRGRETTWNSQSSGDSSSKSRSSNDPYGGMKLVPDSYVE